MAVDSKLGQEIAQYAQGTCHSEHEIAETFGVTDDEVLKACEDNEVGRCDTCSWWVEICELDEDGNCEDHKDE